MLKEVDPDPYSVLTQLVAEVADMQGPLWDMLRLPDHVLEEMNYRKDLMSPVVSVDGTVYLVLPSGKICEAFNQKNNLSSTISDDI